MKQLGREPIKIIVEDFGPIERANIELGDFTAIIGPNSSGKTFMINLVDRLMNFASNVYSFTLPNSVFRAVEALIVKEVNRGYPININMSEYPEDQITMVVDHVIVDLARIGNQQNNGPGNIYAPFFQYFQTDAKNLIQFGKDQARINARFDLMKIEIIVSHDKPPSIAFFPNRDFITKFVKGFVANFVGKGSGSYGSSFRPQQSRSVLIPTERLSVLVTLPNIIEDLAKSRGLQSLFPILQQGQQRQVSNPSLMEFLSNYLGAIQSISVTKTEISKDASDLIMGNLTLDVSLPYFINFSSGGNALPLNLVSSGTLQLIPLVVLAESNLNSVLLIEEPEINLHANKQVEVAEYLWKLVEERDKTILVSTHSDYFVMKLAHLSKDNRNKVLRVYLLNEGHTTPLKISKKGEIEEIRTIGEVMNKLLLEI